MHYLHANDLPIHRVRCRERRILFEPKSFALISDKSENDALTLTIPSFASSIVVVLPK